MIFMIGLVFSVGMNCKVTVIFLLQLRNTQQKNKLTYI